MRKTCAICAMEFTTETRRVQTCSVRCGNELKKRKGAEKRRAEIPEGVLDLRSGDHRGARPAIKGCVVCGRRFAVPAYISHQY